MNTRTWSTVRFEGEVPISKSDAWWGEGAKRIWDLEDKKSMKQLEALYDDSPYVKK